MAVFDQPQNGGNGDGMIDLGDAVYPKLRLWIDADHNGVSEPNELHKLQDFNVSRISLSYRLTERVDKYGNEFRYRGEIGDSSRNRWAWDVILLTSPSERFSQPSSTSLLRGLGW